jgi:hypothetical protein
VTADRLNPIHGSGKPIETVLARHTIARAVYVAPVVLVLFWATSGVSGLASAAIGVAVVVANFLLAGAMLSVAARISLAMYHAAALFGFFLRLGLVTVTMLVIASVFEIDRVAFGISAVVTYLVLVGLEMVAVSRGRERELEWMD